MEQIEIASEREASDKKRERSRNHPGNSLIRCIEFIQDIKRLMGYKSHSRKSLASAFDVNPNSGAFSTKLAACFQFGQLEGNSNGMTITNLARRIIAPVSDNDKQAAIRESFRHPPLYKELISAFSGEPLPQELANILLHDYGITETAKDNCAKCFTESAEFAGFLDSNDVFLDPDEKPVSTGQKALSVIEEVEFEETETSKPTHSHKTVDGNQITLPVTGGRKVTLILPDGLKEADIKILKAQLDVLSLQIQLNADLGEISE